MSTAKEINVQGVVHFLRLAQGVNAMRSRDGNTYLYENGEMRLFNGIRPESATQRCAGFSSYAEGRRWCIEKTCNSRPEMSIYTALRNLLRDITGSRTYMRRRIWVCGKC